MGRVNSLKGGGGTLTHMDNLLSSHITEYLADHVTLGWVKLPFVDAKMERFPRRLVESTSRKEKEQQLVA